MGNKHPQWPDFCNLVSSYLANQGNCTHDLKWTEHALLALGFDEQEIKASLAALAAGGGGCDCEILMNLNGPNGNLPRPAKSAQGKGLDREQHEVFGRLLTGVSTFLNRLATQLERAYGSGGRAADSARSVVNQLRASLSLRAQQELPADSHPAQFYYPVPDNTPTCERVNLAEMAKCLRCGLGESSYRRGVSQALSMAGDLVRGGASADDLDVLTDLAMDWRNHARPDVHVPEDLVPLWRRGARGITGIDPRVLGVERRP
jgi:hypothetical protein